MQNEIWFLDLESNKLYKVKANFYSINYEEDKNINFNQYKIQANIDKIAKDNYSMPHLQYMNMSMAKHDYICIVCHSLYYNLNYFYGLLKKKLLLTIPRKNKEKNRYTKNTLS